MRKTIVALMLSSIVFMAYPAHAQMESLGQFGKNLVNWDNRPKGFYSSEHFDFWHNLDLKDPSQVEHFRQTEEILENAYLWMSGPDVFNHRIEKKIPVILFNTHSAMESNPLVGGFMPEGVGAFVEHTRTRMFLKADFSKPLFRAIGVHELVHEFQIDIGLNGFFKRLGGVFKVPNGYIEGFAEYVASLYTPHTRDNIRRLYERMIASNPKSLPTWFDLRRDAVNGYTMWKMVFEFIDNEVSRDAAIHFGVDGLRNSKLGELIYDLAKGRLGNPDTNPEKFDQVARDFWAKKYELDRISRPKPHHETENFKGRSVTPYGHPYPILSPILSPDGKSIVGFSIQRNGVTLISYDVPVDLPYLSKKEREDKKAKEDKSDKKEPEFNPKKPVRNLTPQLPPRPWEYLVVQNLENWPLSGFDNAWSRSGDKVAFFARVNRDHALVLIDPKKGKVLDIIEMDVDQSFSPSFSPDGKKVYFSAAKNITRDIYVIDIEEKNAVARKVTDDAGFDTAPAVSPDGTKIVYVSSVGDYQHLFMLNLSTGSKEQLTFGRSNEDSPSWSDDGKILVYASDQEAQISNLYTMELASRTISQWTNFFGIVATPIFARNSTDTVYYAILRDDDQYANRIYTNYEVFEIKLLKPVRQFVSEDKGESDLYSFHPYKDLTRTELDQNQIDEPAKVPDRWRINVGQIDFGGSAIGWYSQAYVDFSNMLETKNHSILYAASGNIFRVIDYRYANLEKRLNYGWRGYSYKFPSFYRYYNMGVGRPRQPILNASLTNDYGIEFFSAYPINKYERFEFFSRARYQDYYIRGGQETLDLYSEFFIEADFQMYRFLRNSSGTSLVFGTAYVKDTVIYSGVTQGPLHGNALKAKIEFAPSVGSLKGFTTATFDSRVYRVLTPGGGVMFAGRFTSLVSSNPSGDLVMLGGPGTIRGERYGMFAGNQAAYASVEIRFPFINAVIAPGNTAVGPFRGLIFADAGVARFSDERLPFQKGATYGAGIQFLPLNFVWSRHDGKFKYNVYLTVNW